MKTMGWKPLFWTFSEIIAPKKSITSFAKSYSKINHIAELGFASSNLIEAHFWALDNTVDCCREILREVNLGVPQNINQNVNVQLIVKKELSILAVDVKKIRTAAEEKFNNIIPKCVQILDFWLWETPAIERSKTTQYYNMGSFLIAQSRELSLCQKPKFERTSV